MAGFNKAKSAAYDSVGKQQYYRSLSAHERHVAYMQDYVAFYGGGQAATQSSDPAGLLQDTDLTALQRAHRFVRTEQDDAAGGAWEVRLARRYYQRLFKEYCIADLSRFKESKLGLRWRTEKEVVSGKGQFLCGTKGCDEKAGLCSYEVNFAYMEAGQKKQALVKLRICPTCAVKLNYKREKEYQKAQPVKDTHGRRRGRDGSGSDEDRDPERHAKRANLRAAEELLRRVAAGETLDPVELPGKPDSMAPPFSRPGGSAVGQAQGQQQQASVLPGDDSLWEQKPAQEIATAEEDFEQYFDGLFM